MSFVKIIVFCLIIVFCGTCLQAKAVSNSYELTWSKEFWVLGTGATIFLTSELLDKNSFEIADCEIQKLDAQNINRFDRISTNHYSPKLAFLSDAVLSLLVLSPTLALFSTDKFEDKKILASLWGENLFLARSTSMIFKKTFKRKRPFLYNKSIPTIAKKKKKSDESFISGHSTIAFASAILLSKINDKTDLLGDPKSVWTTSTSLAALVAYLRRVSGNHFPTDVLAGAIVGSLIGHFVAEIHEAEKSSQTQNFCFFVRFELD